MEKRSPYHTDEHNIYLYLLYGQKTNNLPLNFNMIIYISYDASSKLMISTKL